jgi:hypothetical protein
MTYTHETYRAKLEEDLKNASDAPTEYGVSEKQSIEMDLFYLDQDPETILRCVNCEPQNEDGTYMCKFCAHGGDLPPC